MGKGQKSKRRTDWQAGSAAALTSSSPCRRVCVRVCGMWVSVEATAAQVVGDDDVGDGVEDELDVGGVGGARLVTVDLLGRALVLRLELRLDVRRRLLVRLRACHTHTHTRSHASNVDRLHMYMFEYVYMCVHMC